jgi:hypothetical protein
MKLSSAEVVVTLETSYLCLSCANIVHESNKKAT